MMRTLKISTYLAADLETVKSYLMTPALLNYVVAGLMKFHPIEPKNEPTVISFRQNGLRAKNLIIEVLSLKMESFYEK